MKIIKLLLSVSLISSILLSCSSATNTEDKQVTTLKGSYSFSKNYVDNSECTKEHESISFLDNQIFTREYTSFRNDYTFRTDIHNGFYKIVNNEVYFYEDKDLTKPYYLLRADGKKDLCSLRYVYSTNSITANSDVFNINFLYKKDGSTKKINKTYLYSETFNDNPECKQVTTNITFNNNNELSIVSEEIQLDDTKKIKKEIGFYKVIDNYICLYRDSNLSIPLSFYGFNYLETKNKDSEEYLIANELRFNLKDTNQ